MKATTVQKKTSLSYVYRMCILLLQLAFWLDLEVAYTALYIIGIRQVVLVTLLGQAFVQDTYHESRVFSTDKEYERPKHLKTV